MNQAVEIESDICELSFFKSKFSTEPVRRATVLSSFFAAHTPSATKDVSLFSPAVFNGKRSKENVKQVNLLVFDWDDLDAKQVETGLGKAADAGWSFFAMTTFSHGEKGSRWRVVFPVSRPIMPDEFGDVWSCVDGMLGGLADPATRDSSRMYYVPSCPVDKQFMAQVINQDGQPVDIDAILERIAVQEEAAADEPTPAAPPPPTATGNGDDIERRAIAYLRTIPPGVAGQNGSSPTYVAARAMVKGFCLSESKALELLLCHYNGRCSPPWSRKELEHKVRDAATKPFNKPDGWLLDEKQAATATAEPDANSSEPDWPVFDIHSALSSPQPRPEELIKNVLFRGGKFYLSAPSKARKTFFLMHLGLHVAFGRQWLGHDVVRGKVLYVNFELSQFSFESRVASIIRKCGIMTEPGQFDVLHLRGKKATVELLEKFVHGDYAMVIFDPLYKMLGHRNENSSSDMSDLFNRLEAIASRNGCAVVIAHHFAKGNAAGKESMDRGAGSGVQARDGDCIVTMTPHEEEDCFSLEFVLRDFPPQEPAVIRWQYPCFVCDDGLDPARLKQPIGKKATPITQEDVVHVAGTDAKTRAQLHFALKEYTGRGIGVCKEAVSMAIQAGLFDERKVKRSGTNDATFYSVRQTGDQND